MDSREEKYLSYMLRLWRAVSEAGGAWRASLEDPQTGERKGFADLQGLFGYLSERTEPVGSLSAAEDDLTPDEPVQG